MVARARSRTAESTRQDAGWVTAQSLSRGGDDPTLATALMQTGLRSPHELVRVAAAISSFGVVVDPRPNLRILVRATRSADPLIREVAATGLARLQPESPALDRMLKSRRASGPAEPAHTSMIIHGTWGSSSTWWQPGGGYYDFLNGLRGDVYGAADRFSWSGGWSDAARSMGAADLGTWVAGKGVAGLDVYAHSHGGSVAMLATQSGLAMGKLILLSCPVHDRYRPNFAQVPRVVSVRVKADLVILADGGGQRFPGNSGIQEIVLPIWFDHFKSHEAEVWHKHNLFTRT